MRRPLRIARVAAFIVASLGAPAARADLHDHVPPPRAVEKRISLRDATRLGAARGPDGTVAAAPRAAVAETKRAADAIFTTLPRATLIAGDRVGPQGSSLEVGASVTQDLPLAGVRGARKEAAATYGRVVEQALALARLDGASRAALAWIDLAEADAVLAYRHEGLAQAEAILRSIRVRVAKGAADPIELSLAQGEVATARAAVLAAEGMRFDAEMELRFALGEAPDAALATAGDLDGIPTAPGDEASLIRRAEHSHPQLLLADARAEQARREADLSAATLAPTIGVGVSYLREGTGDQIVTGTISLPLPIARPWAFEASRLRAAVDVARAQGARARAELSREIRSALHEREHTRELHDTLAREALVPMKEALRLARAQFDAGTIDVTRVLLARQRLVATEEQTVRALADVRRADVRLMRAAGTLLDGAGP